MDICSVGGPRPSCFGTGGFGDGASEVRKRKNAGRIMPRGIQTARLSEDLGVDRGLPGRWENDTEWTETTGQPVL